MGTHSGRPPQRALIYHFTHLDNLPSILAMGRLVADSATDTAQAVIDVGDAEVKARRRARPIRCGPGGVAADYVPFYFAPRSPMMYRIACDHRDGIPGRYPLGDEPLVYLVSSVDRVIQAQLAWVASDGNCAVSLTRFSADVTDLVDLVDWPLMKQTVWRNTDEDPDRLRRRMAEFLVHREFPLHALAGYVVQTETRRHELVEILTAAGVTGAYLDVRPEWYYGYQARSS